MGIELLKVSPQMAASLAVSGEKLARFARSASLDSRDQREVPTRKIVCPTVKTRVNETFRKVDAALSWMDEAELCACANA